MSKDKVSYTQFKKETNWGEPQLQNKLDVDEVELVLPIPSPKTTSETAPVNAPVNAPAKLNKTQSAIINDLLKDNGHWEVLLGIEI